MIRDYQTQVLKDTRLNKGTPTGIMEFPESNMRDDIRKQLARQKVQTARIGLSQGLKTTREQQLAKAYPVTEWPPKR